MIWFYRTIALAVLAAITTFSQSKLLEHQAELQRLQDDPEREVLYLPDGTGLRFLSFGYTNFVADVLWFNAISYFGKHYQTDQDYTWLSHMCNLVIDLEPRAKHVVEFCGTMLAWEADRPEQALAILERGVAHEPDYWNYYYLKGFTEFYFLDDSESAQRSFQAGSILPDAPAFLARLAAEKMLASDPSSAVAFLSQMIRDAESGIRPLDQMQIDSLKDKLKQSIHELNLQRFDAAVTAYIEQQGRAPKDLDELVSAGLIEKQNFRDPFGGKYYMDLEQVVVQSTGKPARKRATKGLKK